MFVCIWVQYLFICHLKCLPQTENGLSSVITSQFCHLGRFFCCFSWFLQMLYGRCEWILSPSFVTQLRGGTSNSHRCHSVHKEQHGHGSSAEPWWLWIQLPLVITHRRIWPFWKSTVCLSQPQSGRLTYFPWLFSLACKCQGRPQSLSRKGPCMSVRPSFP